MRWCYLTLFLISLFNFINNDSDYEKMEMRGEKVDVNRIRQNVKEGMIVKPQFVTMSMICKELTTANVPK